MKYHNEQPQHGDEYNIEELAFGNAVAAGLLFAGGILCGIAASVFVYYIATL